MPDLTEHADETGILIEAEEFTDYGGWTLDSQFETQMGSPYLLAHGLGKPVADATTVVSVAKPGRYIVWVRTKDWVPEHHPGRFVLLVNDAPVGTELGASGQDWSWERAGTVALETGDVTLTLHDLTGFEGRCDAIYLGKADVAPPNGTDSATRAWRKRLRGLPEQPIDAGDFDLVVVGGGVTGSIATVAAARLGLKVALLQNRPVLGGNASVEIGLTPQGTKTDLIRELCARKSDGELAALDVLGAEPNASLYLEHTVYELVVQDGKILSVDARDARTGRERRFRATAFIDCTGTAILGLLSGAETMFGCESQAEFGESLAPPERVESHHGNTVFFRTRMADQPAPFPEVPWALEVAKDYANLNGQLEKPGVDNAAGPVAGPDKEPDPSVRRRMLLPLTHFWEYGQSLDPYSDGEHVRDHLLRAIYGTFSNVKTLEPETYVNLELDWVSFVPGQGEFRRYKGDYILTETDIREHREFPDSIVQNSGAFCLHYPGHEKYDFRLKDWRWDTRDGEPFSLPFRCLYSAGVENLLMAGKHISVTHIAGSVTKFMANGGQHAIATAAAVALCKKYETTPRRLCREHMDELRSVVDALGYASGGR